MVMGKSVVEYSPGSPSGYSNGCGAIASATDESISDCGASVAQSDDIVFGTPSSSIVTVSVLNRRMQYRPSLRATSFEYESAASLSAVFT